MTSFALMDIAFAISTIWRWATLREATFVRGGILISMLSSISSAALFMPFQSMIPFFTGCLAR